MAYTVGQTEVDVFPNAKGWDSALAAQIDPQVEAIGKRIGDQLAKKIRESLGEGVGTAPVDAPAREQGGRAGDAFGDAFKKRVRAALANLPDANVKLEDAAAQAKLDQLRAELKDLSGKRIGIDISDADALARVEAIKAKIDELGRESASVRVKVDTAAASLELDRFFAATKIKAEDTGDSVGKNISGGAAKSAKSVSPLIAAAVAGGLIAGAPAVLAGAGVMFAGIAAAAVHSNAQVQAAFTATKTSIESTFTNAAQVTVPFFVSAMNRIGAAVTALGPQFHSAFAALGAPIDSLTTGLIALANNAMPGIVSAVRSAGPVFQGLASLMASIGTGIGQMFQIISEHSTAAATVFSALGSAVGSLLPIIGQLVGVGAELGAAILPPLASILGVVERVLNAIAPILPVVAAGFLAFKGAQMASNYLDGFAQKAGKASSAVSGISSALPTLVTSLAVLGSLWQAQDSAISGWAQALQQGGRAAADATAEIKKQENAGLALNQWWDRAKGLWNDGVAQLKGYSSALDEAQSKSRDYYNSLSPLGKAQADVTRTQNDLQLAVDKWGSSSGQAIGAADAYRDAMQRQKGIEDQLNTAIHGVTQAMIDQADEALAAIDSNFALQHAQNQQRDAEIALKDAIKQHGAASTQAHDASQAYTESIYRTADAAAKLKADQSGLKSGTLEYKQVLDTQLLASLEQVRGTLSGPAADAVDGFIATLKAAGVTSDTTGQKLDNLGQKTPTPTVNLNKAPFDTKLQQAQGDMSALAMQEPTPKANLNKSPFDINYGALSNTLNFLNNWHVYPSASLVDMASANIARIQRGLDGLQNKTITVTTYNRIVSSGPAGLGGAALPQAQGGIVKMFADGGFNPMAANIAQVVPPGTKRIIGDNPNSDEAYIPINNSARSLAILGETAARMGLGLTSGANSGSGPAQFTGNLYLDSGEFLGKVYGVAAQATADYADAASTRSRFNR